ncbi:MAG: hypothetical protein ACKO4T_13400 [Planctomycetaceae bacterium]
MPPLLRIAVVCIALSVAAHAATPARTLAPEDASVPRIDDYAAASAAAREANAMLLVAVDPQGGPCLLDRPELAERFASSGTQWVFCRPDASTAAALAADPGLVEMRSGAGVFVVDHAHDAWRGRIVSVLPQTPGTYYRFEPHHLDELASLPEGSLTQRSMILAVRLHPEGPRSAEGFCDPGLSAEAAAHSAHQASIRRQGHHGWETRAQRLGGAAAEVCAQSWENQDMMDSCVDCVASWRQSSGHWRAVSGSHAAYGYDIRRGGDGIWYATGIFRD